MTIEMLILIGGIVLLFSVFLSKVTYRYGIPTLILFLLLGLVFGNQAFGIIKDFNSNNPSALKIAEMIASFALMVIIFSGGFDTNWKKAKTNANVSIVLASVGVFLTALIVGTFSFLLLKNKGFTLLQGMLIGAIISSTDAAAVFSILRSKKLNFKNDLGPLLEMESGSNDPSAYMVSIIIVGAILKESSNIVLTFLLQVVSGIGVGALVGIFAPKIINKIKLEIDGLYIILGIGFMLLSFGLADFLGGNGYLAVYITGLIMGNTKIMYRPSLTQFFDGFSWLAQILMFFVLGLFADTSNLIPALIPGVLIALFISFIGRPLVIIPIMKLFKKTIKDSILVSWVGFRGAASIVIAIFVLSKFSGAGSIDQTLPSKGILIFDIVFIVAVVSVLLQGLLLVPVASWLGLSEPEETELKVFTDYSGAISTDLLEVPIGTENILIGRSLKEISIPQEILVILIKRNDEMIPPRGREVIQANDVLLLASSDNLALLEADKRMKERLLEIENSKKKL